MSSARFRWLRVVPVAVCCDERISLFRSPATAFVGAGPAGGLKDRVDHRPGGLNRVLSGEERSIASHGISQKPLVGRFLSRLLFNQIEFLLVSDELLPCAFDASGEGDGGAGGQP